MNIIMYMNLLTINSLPIVFFDIANLLKNIICTKFKAKNYKILIAFVCLLFKMA